MMVARSMLNMFMVRAVEGKAEYIAVVFCGSRRYKTAVVEDCWECVEVWQSKIVLAASRCAFL